ncbi:hypothetical protein ON010_g14826 [Phytophthora cinnamomi]|nr:hypothetical protein ON010_g14826 [Phytophthora cinnamomi]
MWLALHSSPLVHDVLAKASVDLAHSAIQQIVERLAVARTASITANAQILHVAHRRDHSVEVRVVEEHERVPLALVCHHAVHRGQALARRNQRQVVSGVRYERTGYVRARPPTSRRGTPAALPRGLA